MDVLTHFVTGSALGVVFFEEKFIPIFGGYSLLISMIIGAVIGVLPDIDVLNKRFKSHIYYMENHRKWSHSVFTHLIISFLLSILFNYFIFKHTTVFSLNNLKTAGCFFAILFSHISLDFFTSWGLHYLHPIKKEFATSSVYVVDFFVSIAMITQFGLLLLGNKIYWPLIFVLIYLLLGLCVRRFYIVPIFKKQLFKQNIDYYELDVRPTFLNCFLWSANACTKEGFTTGYYSVFQQKKEIVFFDHKKNTEFMFEYKEFNMTDLLVLKNRFQSVVNNWYSFSEIEGKLYINDVRYMFKTFAMGEIRYAQPYLILANKKGRLDVKLDQKLVKGWLGILIKRIFQK